MLGAEKQIVGISTNVYQGNGYRYYAAMDPRIKNKTIPTPGNWDFVNIESVIALKPDLVIIWSKQTESVAALEERGIRVFGVFIEKKEDVYREILEIGRTHRKARKGQRSLLHIQKKRLKGSINALHRFQKRNVRESTICGHRGTLRHPAGRALSRI